MTDTTIPTSEVLYRAADLIEERGWGHGDGSMIGEVGLCLMGAIYAASFGRFAVSDNLDYEDSALCPAGRAVYRHLALDADDLDAGWRWNDGHWTYDHDGHAWVTEDPNAAIATLRAAAVIEAAKENADVRESVTVR